MFFANVCLWFSPKGLAEMLHWRCSQQKNTNGFKRHLDLFLEWSTEWVEDWEFRLPVGVGLGALKKPPGCLKGRFFFQKYIFFKLEERSSAPSKTQATNQVSPLIYLNTCPCLAWFSEMIPIQPSKWTNQFCRMLPLPACSHHWDFATKRSASK